jgi:hypothetical protein
MKRSAFVISFVFLCTMVFINVSSAANIGFNGIGGKVGYVMPDLADNTLGFGLLADLGTIIPNLSLEGCVDYWGNSYDLFGVKTSLSIISIGPTVKYNFPIGSSLIPFAGGGLVLAISRAKMEWEGGTGLFGEPLTGADTSSSDTNIDVPVVGGISLPIGSGMKFIAEARYLLDAGTFWISGGIMVKLK